MGRVLISIIDPNPLFRAALAQLLPATLCRVIACADVDDREAAHSSAGLFIVGPENAHPVYTVKKLHEAYPRSRILVLSNTFDRQVLCEAFSSGANGYLPKSAHLDVLVKTVELLLDDHLRGTTRNLPAEPPNKTHSVEFNSSAASRASWEELQLKYNLSDREINVLLLVTQGWPNKIIAFRLRLAEATVKVHIKAVLRKIGARNRTQAAVWAIENGLARRNDGHEINLV